MINFSFLERFHFKTYIPFYQKDCSFLKKDYIFYPKGLYLFFKPKIQSENIFSTFAPDLEINYFDTEKMIIRENTDNIFIEDYIIPKGNEKVDIKARENVVWAMLGKWLSVNPLKRKKNIELNDFIYLRFDGMQETVNKAARN